MMFSLPVMSRARAPVPRLMLALMSSSTILTLPLKLMSLMAASILAVSLSIVARKSLILRLMSPSMSSSFIMPLALSPRPLMLATVLAPRSVYLTSMLLSASLLRSIGNEPPSSASFGSASLGGKMSRLLLPSVSKNTFTRPPSSRQLFTMISSSNSIFLRLTDTTSLSMAARVSVVQPLVGLMSTTSLISMPASGNVLNNVKSTFPML